MAVVAGEPPDPMLTAGVANLPINGPDEFSLTRDFMTMRSVGFMRELTRNDKLEARALRFEREAEAAEARRTLAVATLRQGAAVAWFDRYYNERMLAVLLEQRDQARLQVDAADLAYRSGLGPQSDAFAARSSVAEIEDRIATAQRDIAVATTRLARWIGTAADGPLDDPPPIDTVSLHAADLEAGIAHHPQIAVMIKEEQTALAEAEIARTQKRADWTIELMYSQRGSAFSDMVSVNVSRPLQWRQRSRQDRELAAKLAMAARMRAERDEETRAHVAEARMLLQAWQSNRGRLERYTAVLIPLARERTIAAATAYSGGTGTLAAALDARLAEVETRLAQVELELETAMLWAELNYLIPTVRARVPQT